METDVIYELEGQGHATDAKWRMILADERLERVREKEREYREWNKDRAADAGWKDFRIVKVTTTTEVVT